MTPAAAKPAGLHAKIAHVMGELEAIPKLGRHPTHGYAFMRESDVLAAVRKHLAAAGVAVYISSRQLQAFPVERASGKATRITEVEVSITFADSASGETFTIQGAGSGEDVLEKGTYKAITGGVKYALLKTFLVGGDDDPEAHAEPEPEAAAWSPDWTVIPDLQRRVKAAGGDPELAWSAALEAAGLKPGDTATRDQYDTIIRSLEAETGDVK